MSYTYANRKQPGKSVPEKEMASAQPSLDALRSGAARPTQEQLGHRVDLPDTMREKMETAFGADLSAVKLYESDAVAEAGANAITQGSNIAFAPGMLDFTSFGGQALLGHELSHVVSQSRGEVTGGGFLNDHALEARADREGAMAAAGQTVAMPAAALSSVTAAPAAGPMQANKEDKYRRQQAEYYDQAALSSDPDMREKLRKKYNKAKANKEKQMRKRGVTKQSDFDEDNFNITGGVAQLNRARARNGDDDVGYFNDAGKILNFMPDEQLMHDKETGFREKMVDDYTAFRKGRGSVGGNEFWDPKLEAYSPLGEMYSRMMGGENIRKAVMENDMAGSVASITEMAKEKKVAPLLARQFNAYHGEDAAGGDKESNFMQNFWGYAVTKPNQLTFGSKFVRDSEDTLYDEEYGLSSYTQENLDYTEQEYANAHMDPHNAPADYLNPDSETKDPDAVAYAFLRMVSGQKRRR